MRRLSVSVLVLGAMAGGAFADVTAEDIWRDWQATLAGFGFEVTGIPQRSAGGIVIADLGLTQDIPEDGGRIEMRLGRIELAERGDGSVTVIYPETMPMALAVSPEEGEPVTVILTLAQTGLEIIASGTPEALRYAYSADELRLALGEVTIGGEPQETLEGVIRLTGVAGESVTQPEGTGRQMVQNLTSGPVSYALRFEMPEEDNSFDYAGAAEWMTYDTRMHLPDDIDMARMGDALNAGLEMEGRMRFGAGEGRYVVTEAGETTRVASGNARSSLHFALSAEGVSYGGEAEDSRTEAHLPILPMPLAYEVARMAGRFTMPLAPSEAMQDFGVALEMNAIRLSETIWALLDPAANLPRDPMDLVLDLSGKGRLTVDLFDPAMIEMLEETGREPGVIERIDLNRLLVSALGARLTGAGSVEMDAPSGTGLPAVEGAVDLRLEGGNALLDRLIGMGIVPEEQAMMVRMMAGLFARAVEGEDTLTSRVEVAKDGALTVNGQRLR
ncbi:DUF2125 domain-containing protein [Roseovarius autotrophicus]|uniref:DUF2125 domain-containing protein n=1 Tax=Roseovarius autotrophicus TaxID=2824121 RepID=UPI0019F27175|nr:DUF2125 domain-containing protein [Roseovarius autotrophicus]MBE0455162.1 DUF2125 domain-containing protein [Roseovarius sp.]